MFYIRMKADKLLRKVKSYWQICILSRPGFAGGILVWVTLTYRPGPRQHEVGSGLRQMECCR